MNRKKSLLVITSISFIFIIVFQTILINLTVKKIIDNLYLQIIPTILAIIPSLISILTIKDENESDKQHIVLKEPRDTEFQKDKVEVLRSFYKAIKEKKWKEALRIINNPNHEIYFRRFFPYYSSKIGNNTLTLKAVNFTIVLCNDPEITDQNTKESPKFSNNTDKFNSILQDFLQDFLETYSNVVIDQEYELERFRSMIDTNQVVKLMKNINNYAKIFQREDFAGLKISRIKFTVRLRSFSNHTLQIWKNPPNGYIVQVTSHLDEHNKKDTIGCQFGFTKKEQRNFIQKNGHNKPELFDQLIETFFTQVKEDIL